MTDARARTAATLLLLAAVAGLVGLPVARLVAVALGEGIGGFLGALAGPLAAGAMLNSLWTSTAVMVLAVTLGTLAAFVTERRAGRVRTLLRAGLAVPLIVPPFVLAFGWTRAFGPRGLTDQLLGLELPGLFGPLGIVLVVSVAATPLAWLVVAAALATRAEPELEDAARASGAGPRTAFVTVTLPLLRPALLGAAAITFVYAMNAFGVPQVLGTAAGFPTITTRLYQDVALSAQPAAFDRAIALATTMVVIGGLVVGTGDAVLGRGGARRTGQPSGTRRRPASGRAATAASTLLAVGLLVTVGVPLLAVLLSALTRAAGLAPVPANWTLDNFGLAVADGRFGGALGRSLVLSSLAATVVLALAALFLAALRGNRARFGATALTLGFAIPGSALAIAVLLAWGGLLRNTLLIILVAYVAKLLALGHRQLAGSVDRLPPDLLRAARASGAGPLVAVRDVAAPILRRSALAAWAIVFVFGLHELTMSTLLYGPGTSTLAVHVLNVQQLGDPTISAALAVILTVLVGAAALPLLAGDRDAAAARRGWQAG